MAQSAQQWTGNYVTGAWQTAIVRYVGATNNRCSRWSATLAYGTVKYRAYVPYSEGPLAAVEKMIKAANMPWRIATVGTVDTSTYAVICCNDWQDT